MPWELWKREVVCTGLVFLIVFFLINIQPASHAFLEGYTGLQ